MSKKVKILGTGMAVPSLKVSVAEVEQRLGLAAGWVAATGGVLNRHFVNGEMTASEMGARAARQAIEAAGLQLSDIDLILSASGTQEQVIPCTAIFIQRALGLENSGVPAFDVNSTCLSFVMALDVAANYIALGSYKNILIVSAEIPSVGINWEHRESCSILGDGAGAVVIGASGAEETSAIHRTLLRSYSSQAETCQIQGGGTKLFATQFDKDHPAPFLFEMDGMKTFKFLSLRFKEFVREFMAPLGKDLLDMDLIIPHQTSKSSMDLVLRRRMAIPEHKLVDIIAGYGNTVAASIPMAMHIAIGDGRLKRGDQVVLIGTSAGLSVGAVALTY